MKTVKSLLVMFLVLVMASAALADNVRVIKRTLKIQPDNDHQELEYNWPIVSGMNDSKIQDKINQDLYNWFMTDMWAKEITKAPVIKVPAPFDGDVMLRHEVLVKYEIPFCDKDLLCITRFAYEYTGGAHGMSVKAFRLIDLSSGKILKLDDLLVKDYQKQLDAQINKRAPREELFEKDQPVGTKQMGGWFITKEALIIHYDLYSIAPYSSGFIEIAIPWDEMSELIKKDGLLGGLVQK